MRELLGVGQRVLGKNFCFEFLQFNTQIQAMIQKYKNFGKWHIIQKIICYKPHLNSIYSLKSTTLRYCVFLQKVMKKSL